MKNHCILFQGTESNGFILEEVKNCLMKEDYLRWIYSELKTWQPTMARDLKWAISKKQKCNKRYFLAKMFLLRNKMSVIVCGPTSLSFLVQRLFFNIFAYTYNLKSHLQLIILLLEKVFLRPSIPSGFHPNDRL